MPLVDTSTWIDYLNRRSTPATELLRAWYEDRTVIVADLILMEILRGFRDERRAQQVLLSLLPLSCVTLGGEAIAIAAAANYRALRQRGITVRSSIDCLIATYCIENDVELLHSDRDFAPFEEHLGLRVVRP